MRKRDYFSKDFKVIYPEILRRDNNRCVKCGQTSNLEIHHVNGYEDNTPENLKTLCYWCHGVAPMGTEEFDAWLGNGKTGREHAKEFVIDRVDFSFKEEIRDSIVENAISAYDEYRNLTHLDKLKVARERKRAKTGKCEGRKSYTESNPEIIREVKRLRRKSKNRKQMSFSQIAIYLNDKGHLTQSGGVFTGANVQILLRRNAIKS